MCLIYKPLPISKRELQLYSGLYCCSSTKYITSTRPWQNFRPNQHHVRQNCSQFRFKADGQIKGNALIPLPPECITNINKFK